jgi:hypothetical protein
MEMGCDEYWLETIRMPLCNTLEVVFKIEWIAVAPAKYLQVNERSFVMVEE